jgi:RNase P subunit RPR2
MAGNNNIRVSRGFLVICDECHSFLKKEEWIDVKNYSKADEIIHELCANCADYNKPLIDDLLGSSE